MADALRSALPPERKVAQIVVSLEGDAWPTDITLERASSGYRIIYPHGSHQRYVLALRPFLQAYLFWFDSCPAAVQRMTVTGSDGDEPSRARFAPSARVPAQTVIPDPHFFRTHGFERERDLARTAPEWAQRSEAIAWRGTANGPGRLSLDVGEVDDPTIRARVRLVMRLAGVPQCDVALSELPGALEVWAGVARQLRYLAAALPPEHWLTHKYAIDIDGQTNTWSNFFVRMLFGCCVFKVDSQLGFRQWYYDRLKPFEHYVPVRADMSDFLDKIEWARGHQAEAREIAAAGQRFAMALDFEAGKREAVDIITANWDKRGL